MSCCQNVWVPKYLVVIMSGCQKGGCQNVLVSKCRVPKCRRIAVYARISLICCLRYSWPNVVLPVVGGFLMDRVLGIRFGTICFAFIICIGQGVFALGGFMDRLWVMEIGR